MAILSTRGVRRFCDDLFPVMVPAHIPHSTTVPPFAYTTYYFLNPRPTGITHLGLIVVTVR